MKKKLVIAAVVVLSLLLAGCESGRSVESKYPKFKYYNSAYNYDPFNREVPVDNGYILDEGNSYDIEETDDGLDIIFHMVAVSAEEG